VILCSYVMHIVIISFSIKSIIWCFDFEKVKISLNKHFLSICFVDFIGKISLKYVNKTERIHFIDLDCI